jgi:hypothetical protein
VTVDASSNTYVAGTFVGSVDFDPSSGVAERTSSGNFDAFVVSYDASGALRFANAFGSENSDQASAVALGAGGSVYAGGLFSGTVDFATDSGTASRTSNGGADAFLVTYDSGGDLLPVELTRFTATLDGSGARLDWTTASETDNSGFAVEHSAPGLGFTRAGWVDGGGTTLEARAYRFRTGELAPGVHRFRLRQIDLDGAETLSPVVELSVGVEGTAFVSVSPNPVSGAGRVSVQAARAQTVRVSVFDALGREVAVLFDGMLGANEAQTFSLDASALGAGVYVVRLAGEGVAQTQTFVVAR